MVNGIKLGVVSKSWAGKIKAKVSPRMISWHCIPCLLTSWCRNPRSFESSNRVSYSQKWFWRSPNWALSHHPFLHNMFTDSQHTFYFIPVWGLGLCAFWTFLSLRHSPYPISYWISCIAGEIFIDWGTRKAVLLSQC